VCKNGVLLRNGFFFLAISTLLLFLFPALAFADDKPKYPQVQSVSSGYFADHYQTVDGHNVDIPSWTLAANVGLSPKMRLELRRFGGASPTINGFQASVVDFEGRIAYRLDSLHVGDDLGPRTYGWVSWRIWTTNQYFNGVHSKYAREEGLGLGITRSAAVSHGFSYGYSFGLYPSVRVNVGKAVSRFSFELGPTYQFCPRIGMGFGYRYQAILTSGLPHQRAQEQGLFYALRGTF